MFVTGVVLANASLDVAMHDRCWMSICITNALISPSRATTDPWASIQNNKETLGGFDSEYIKMFWVGLMDGNGSIQVNHWRRKSLQYRLIIKLSNLPSNYNMLILIAKVIGGQVRITGKGVDVIWVVNNKDVIQKIIKIYEVYPPLTSSKICQLEFLKTCLQENSILYYLSNRDFKYTRQADIVQSYSPFPLPRPFPLGRGKGRLGRGPLYEGITNLLYFKGWLSGFIEAEGCFSIRKSNNHSFSIGQNDDIYLITAIKQFFNATNMVRTSSSTFYSLEIYKKEILNKIINHCNYYPLIGEKAFSLQKFNEVFKQ